MYEREIKIKLNLGSGELPLDGYHNLDHKYGLEAYPLKDYADNSVEEVRASHILEHFPHAEIPAVIKEWVRVLKPGGRLKIAVPDFDMLARAYTNGLHDHLALESFIYGGQTKGDD